MPRRNRVTPMGDIVAVHQRGAWMGNRGILHRGDRLVRSHASDLWIICLLQFRGRWRAQWQPHQYTHLFFLDEAVAFAAGHRPCGECRHADYRAYVEAVPELATSGGPLAQRLNHRLHAERLVRGTSRRRLHAAAWPSVPDGAFVRLEDRSLLVLGASLVEWTSGGYAGRRARPVRGEAEMITPPTSAAVLAAGYPLQIDPSVGRSA